MKKEIKKFLRFNGKTIFFVAVDGTFWVAVKPICEVLNVNYNRQFKNLKLDKILSELLAEQPIVAADKKERKMLCLPEKFIYGWLFSIRSDSLELLQYKKEVYEVLFNHFNGMQIKDEKFLKLQEIKDRSRKLNKSLKKHDADLLHGQTNFNI